MATKDVQVLAGLGYKQEFKRAIRPLEMAGMAFSIIGLFPSTTSTLSLSLPNGGTAGLIWGWTICSFFGTIVACALAELASAAPTAGGLYFWTFKYASPKWRRLLCWIVGYSNTMGVAAGMASCIWACSVQLLAAVSIGTNLSFTPTNAQIYGVYVALFIVTSTFASIATETIARLQSAYAFLQVSLCFAIIIALPASTPHEFRNTASEVFTKFSNLSAWPTGFAFILSFTGPLWVMAGYDAPMHMSEEAANATTAIPFALVSSLITAAIMGYGINFALTFNMGTDIESIMASPIGQPMATIFFNSFGNKGALAVWAFVVLAQFAVGTNYMIACSRQVFAFARDGALPFSRYLYRMNRYTQTPVNCVWALTLVGLLIGLLGFAGPAAINASFSLSIVGGYIAYTVPISSRLFGPTPWRPGPFSLGKFSVPIAVTAALWLIFAITIVMFPANPNPTVAGMNWTIVVGGGWLGLCIVYFFFPKYGGVYWFKGPMANVRERSDSSVPAYVVTASSDEKDEKYSEE
ncbi:hypothetical protein NM688_g1295 [Phlebia brevispora]|uniref:Uncharacterized protein n=1 Tax=Phlebia brevispora TaxID=194682 RepID=A0ACC1TBW8_9APHY|nr:hypothetical protein NM688_g1295 [Phlebia brevispora]